MTLLIIIACAKGGCGKTTVAEMLTPSAKPLFRSSSTRKASSAARSLLSPTVNVEVCLTAAP